MENISKIHKEEVELMTDDELCGRLRISKQTLRNHLKDGPPSPGAGDIRVIRHVKVGSSRRWLRESVESFINGE